MDNGSIQKITERRSSLQLVRNAYRLVEGNSFKMLFFPFVLTLLFLYGFCFLTIVFPESGASQLLYVGFGIAFLSYLIIGIAINLVQKKEHWFYRDTMALIMSFFKPMMLVGTVLLVVAVWCLGQLANLELEYSGITIGRFISIVLLFFCLYCYSLLVYRERGNILALRSFADFFNLITKNFNRFLGITVVVFIFVSFVVSVNYFADPYIENGKSLFVLLFKPKQLPISGWKLSLTGLFVNSLFLFYIYNLAIVAITILWEGDRPAEETPELDSEEEIKADFQNKINQALFSGEDLEKK